jgi:hypothetical protein
MRVLAPIAFIALVCGCGPSPDAKLPDYFVNRAGGAPGAGGQTATSTALGAGGAGGTSSGVGGSFTGGTGGGTGTGGVTSVGGNVGSGGTTKRTTTLAAPSCSDRTRNQDETDVDCGGAICVTRCFVAMSCAVDGDCKAGLVCDTLTRKCADPCKNGKKDATETGIDCGGSCPSKCTGDPCTANDECQSLNCDTTAGTCKASVHPLSTIKQTCWDDVLKSTPGINPSDGTTAKASVVPCMITNGCCKIPLSSCTEVCFTSNDGTCGVNKTGGGMGPHSFIAAYYQKCVP